MGPIARRDILRTMPSLHSRLGTWELENVHAWSDRALEIRAGSPVRLVGPETRVATIGSCFAAELASMMDVVGINGAMHPGGLFYSTTTIRQELERIAGGWPERAAEPAWASMAAWSTVPRLRHDLPDQASLDAARSAADTAAGEVFNGANVVVVTLGLIETWRSPVTPSTYRQIPTPPRSIARTIVPPADGDRDARRPRAYSDGDPRPARGGDGRHRVAGPAAHDLHAARRARRQRGVEGRIRAAVSEFVDRHPDVHYFHSYEMVVTAERQSDTSATTDATSTGTRSSSSSLSSCASTRTRPPAARRRQLVADADRQDGADPDEGTQGPIAQGRGRDEACQGARPVWRRVARKTKQAVGSALGRA
jgi:hypothetical protein